MSFIYAVQMMIPDHSYSPIKIGFSIEPERRVKEFTRGPFPTVWLGQWPAPNGITDEADAHRRLSEFRLNGEWFYPSPEVVQFVERNLGRSIPLAVRTAKRSKKAERLGERLAAMMPAPNPPPARIPDPFDLPHASRVDDSMEIVRARWPNANRSGWNLNLQCALDAEVADVLGISVDEVRSQVSCIYIDVKSNPYRYLLRHVREYLESRPGRVFSGREVCPVNRSLV